jgi:hypothetical protein
VTETRTRANRRPIVAAGAFCDIDQRRLARIDSIVIIAGMHRRGRVAASVNPYPPNAGDGGVRAATSFVANFKRSEDAEDEFGRDAAHVATQATKGEVQWRACPSTPVITSSQPRVFWLLWLLPSVKLRSSLVNYAGRASGYRYRWLGALTDNKCRAKLLTDQRFAISA